jgi:6-pyruvoyltetrahydropterin/6-carboxytetrahydropterin synthase
MYEVRVETNFSSAHHLLNYKGECENQHGHNWKVEVFVQGEYLDTSGILVDFKILKKELNEVVGYLDHKDINTLPEFKGVSPSSEMLAKFVFEKMTERKFTISKVSVWETPNACASFWKEWDK